MLKIWFGEFKEDCITNPSAYFNFYKKKEWFNRSDIKHIIKEIDNVDAVQDEYLLSPVFGAISPDRLSSGCKCLILLTLNPQCNVYASRCGDNCVPYILDLAEKTDVVITLHHAMSFPQEFEADILDTGVHITNSKEYMHEYIRVRYGG